MYRYVYICHALFLFSDTGREIRKVLWALFRTDSASLFCHCRDKLIARKSRSLVITKIKIRFSNDACSTQAQVMLKKTLFLG